MDEEIALCISHVILTGPRFEWGADHDAVLSIVVDVHAIEAELGGQVTAVRTEKRPHTRHAGAMSIFEYPISSLRGEDGVLAGHQGEAVLLVNVASRCGLTPQYTGLEQLQKSYGDRGFSVIGFPCNQFGGQEPGTAEEIETFCSIKYGVSFPMTEKIEVNGPGRHPIYDELTKVADADGHAGDIRWNFEKFLVGRDGNVIARFSPLV